jgi:hypothetical protein
MQVRRRLQGIAEHGFDDKRRGAASYLLARLLGGFTAMKRWRSRGFDGGGGKLKLGFRRLAARAKGDAGCSGRRPRGQRQP